MQKITRILIASAAAVASLALAPRARAFHDYGQPTCNQPVRTIAMKTNVLRSARPFDRRIAVYFVRGDFLPAIPNSHKWSWDWVYAETNHIPGLQREDSDCDSGAAEPDTMLFSSELACTCGYPFGGFPPLSWIDGDDPIPRP